MFKNKFLEAWKKKYKTTLKIDDLVEVSSGRGEILGQGFVKAISPCQEWIQTTLGLAYMPIKQIKKL